MSYDFSGWLQFTIGVFVIALTVGPAIRKRSTLHIGFLLTGLAALLRGLAVLGEFEERVDVLTMILNLVGVVLAVIAVYGDKRRPDKQEPASK
jgi:hypothetical protein